MAGRAYSTKEYMGILHMWRNRKSVQEIADKYGRTPSAIRNVLSIHRREIDPTLRCEKKHDNRWTTAACERFADMWKHGATLEYIATAFGISVPWCRSVATNIRKQYGTDFIPYRRKFKRAIDGGKNE